jgi:prepilin-type N-terminal cleavage/methylation domain-containing protein
VIAVSLSKNFRHRHHGFTLLELLVAMAVLGIAAALIGSVLASDAAARNIQQRQLRLGQVIEEAKTYVRRHSWDYTITIAANGAFAIAPVAPIPTGLPLVAASGNINTGTSATGTGTGATTTPVTVDVRLGGGTTGPIRFNAPFARPAATNVCIQVTLNDPTGTKQTRVDLLGVTGKVVNRDVRTSFPCPAGF